MAKAKVHSGIPQVPGSPIINDDGVQVGVVGPVAGTDGVPLKPQESKADKFKRLASRRVAKALKVLSQVRSLHNRGQYDYTSEQVAKIVGALNESVKTIAAAFSGEKKKADTFEL